MGSQGAKALPRLANLVSEWFFALRLSSNEGAEACQHLLERAFRFCRKPPNQGASTTLLVATAPGLDGIGGRYFSDNQEATVFDYRPATFAELAGGVATYSLDEGNADRAWNLTTLMLG